MPWRFLDVRTVLCSSTVLFLHVILKHSHRQPSYVNVAHTFLAVGVKPARGILWGTSFSLKVD
jgi:hypothetical protein